MYHKDTIELFKQIPTMEFKHLSQDKNNQFLLIDFGNSRGMKETNKKLLPLKK